MKTKSFIPFIAIALFACTQPMQNNKSVAAFNAEGKTAIIFTTAKDTNYRLTQTGTAEFKKADQPTEGVNSVFVNPNNTYQTFLGIGGALTDASAEVFAKLSKEKQQEFLDAYYGEKGIDYTLMRTNIHSCDFSSGSYTYVDEGDKELKSFNIDHDKQYRLPLIKQAIERAGGTMTLYMSPWSPPAFMKGKTDMLQGGKLLPEFAESWAMYYVKTIKAYEAEGVKVWGLSIQNEPMATQTWESCIYTAEEERDFLKNHLGPTLKREALGDKKIIVWDHNRDLLAHRANTIFDDPEAAKYAWGVGFHWYETWRGGKPNFNALEDVHNAYPDKNILFTEGCNERFTTEKYQYWPNGERYGNSMINDFNRGTVGWTDWNILLDETGGPNHVGNFCFAPIHADTRADSLIYTPSYYYIGHFSKFIRPGAKRIGTTSSASFLESTSFLNENGKMITVVMNSTDNAMGYNLYVGANVAAWFEIPAHAIQTIIY